MPLRAVDGMRSQQVLFHGPAMTTREKTLASEAAAVLVFDGDGGYLGGWGSSGAEPGDLTFPTGVLVDTDGDVYVGDAAGSVEFPGKHRIQKFHVEVSP